MSYLTIGETNCASLDLASRGKVRDIYDLGKQLLIIATDRISAFDVIMRELVPNKGIILTKLSLFWFKMFPGVVRNHFISADPREYPRACRPYASQLAGRSMLVKKCKPLPIEAIVRGYISGSGWKDYQQAGAICGIALPPGLVESEQLPNVMFAPSTKGEQGEHDINISFEEAAKLIGQSTAEFVRDMAIRLYTIGRDYALPRGIIIADTKFEFGLADDGEIILIDEVLTPDSSRFWDLETYSPGKPQVSFDKQPVRDYLDSLSPKWDKKPPSPILPEWVVTNTATRYKEALYRLTGEMIS